ncbi:Mycothiol acetyltransferase [Streptomyces sp. YIM 130001]|uniref:GNAT family N-acetyltransferase n=1 Tax=Streptomyces sp. YIM 130001 TaxID=2259644 RepID=UPI000E6487AB|nr:GNAT family N-acetyltransferase [Streptomyces sp. YIM 130001]RII18358.1 Mycothiol acetyltransferase [Streptomyces sp. YIM 130001]
MTEPPPRDRIEQYYATVPLLFADAEKFGPLHLFVPRAAGEPYYGGPSHARPVRPAEVTAADIDRVRARQRELGVPEAFEWLAETAPAMRALIESAGLPVAERPLMSLAPERTLLPPQLPDGVTIRALGADDLSLPAVLAVPRLAFASDNTGAGPAGAAGLAAQAESAAADGTLAAARPALDAGHKVLLAAFAPDGTPLAAGHYHPAHGTTEIGGVGTVPTARRQGLGAAVTAALAAHAREHGVHTVFLAYASQAVARIYARLGFRPAGTTLLIANQPARGQEL